MNAKWRGRLWVAAALAVVWTVTVIVTAWLVGQAMKGTPALSSSQADLVLAVADFPGLARRAVREVAGRFLGDPTTLLVARAVAEQPQWSRTFPAAGDPGYLLFSGVDPASRHSAVQLIRIADGAVMARWNPDWRALHAQATEKKWGPRFVASDMRALHPLLLDDGSIVFNTEASMVRLQACEARPMWVLDTVMHHSVEKALDESVWAPSVSEEAFPQNAWLHDRLRPDSLARVSLDGRLLENRSFATILEENGLRAMLLGTSGGQVNEDPIHLNQISVAPSDGRHWQRGDLLVSARHLSAVFLYRPSTGRILWHRQGPWMNQHSAAFVDDHRISVFDNDVFGGAPDSDPFVSPGEINRVIVYDFDTNATSEPFASLLAEAKPVTLTEGRAQLLADGGLFIEESNFGRHLRFTSDRLLWSRVNDYDKDRIGIVSWSRYLTAEEASVPLRALASRPCNPPAAAGH